jgi:hypothetical protein
MFNGDGEDDTTALASGLVSGRYERGTMIITSNKSSTKSSAYGGPRRDEVGAVHPHRGQPRGVPVVDPRHHSGRRARFSITSCRNTFTVACAGL